VLVGDDQQLIEGLGLIAEEAVLEEGALSAPGSEVLDRLHLVHALAGIAQLGPAREVLMVLMVPSTPSHSMTGFSYSCVVDDTDLLYVTVVCCCPCAKYHLISRSCISTSL